jgi:hypothetical protein
MCTCTPADTQSLAMSTVEVGEGPEKNERPTYERSQDKPATCAVSDSPSVRSADQETAEPFCSNQARPSMPVTSMWVLGA